MKRFNAGLVAVALLLQVACASKTVIRVSDPQTKIYVDGEYKGMGSVTHSDTKIIGSETAIRLQKDGCQPQTQTLRRDEKFKFWPCVGGVLVLFPFLWIMGYNGEHNYTYECVAAK